MSEWYGKNCIHQCCQWEDNEETGGPDYKEAHPALIFCNHKSNAHDHEGNCSVEQCPQKSQDIEDVRKELRRHDYLYYKLAAPEIEDYDYDMLFKKLQKMEETDPSLVTEDSPTQVVGGFSAQIHMRQNGITEG